MRPLLAATLLTCLPVLAQPRPAPAPPAAPAPPVAPPLAGPGLHAPPGIPPAIAQKLGIPPETVKKVRELTFDANDAAITLEADLKRAQLDLERTLSAPTVDEAAALAKLDTVGKAEQALKKNRFALMLRVRKTVGPELWDKLQGELQAEPHAGLMMLGGGGSGVQRREVRIIRRDDGTTTTTEMNE